MNRPGQLSDILGAIAGVAFALLFFVSIAAVDPLRGATDQELLDWWSDSGKRRASIVSMYAMLVAGLFFLVFLARLRARLRAVEATDGWSALVFASGIVFAAALAICAVSRAMIAQAVRFGDEPLPGPDTLRYATEVQIAALGLIAIPFATLLVAAASALILRTRPFARWVGWLGLTVVAGSLVAVALLRGPLASPLLMVWVLAISFELWRTRGDRAVTVEASRVEAPGQQPRIPVAQR